MNFGNPVGRQANNGNNAMGKVPGSSAKASEADAADLAWFALSGLLSLTDFCRGQFSRVRH